eukprot:CAMPEP_0179166022 /NCGR_PEP_ID=MMETSP0796-20121207/81554_1 /TAXON_ID=73915 /ORGANISM="Pyrodinium bahamense, Strain pbaha01" /LENGTH=100 /DNA_ID=CAMNT_0020868597 /DNA_START=119 /DNA_END=418 /DNA_ORIENTATION=+
MASVELAKVVDCRALSSVYFSLKDSACCSVGASVYMLIVSWYFLGLCMLLCAVPGAALGLLQKATSPLHKVGLARGSLSLIMKGRTGVVRPCVQRSVIEM